MARDWDSERLNAKGILRSLSTEYLEEDAHRRGVLKRWPEAPSSEDAISSTNPERFIPELLLREDDEDVVRFLQTYVQRSVNKLNNWRTGGGDQLVCDGQLKVVEAIEKLSDQGVIEAIPSLLQKLERKALLSIYTIVSGKTRDIKNRVHVVDRIKKFFNKILRGQSGYLLTKPVKDVVTILRYPDSYKKVDSRRIEVEASSPVQAAHSALSQVDQLPLKDMHVMLGTLRNSPPRTIGQLKGGGNKDRLIPSIQNIAGKLLQELEDGDELPEPLRKSLIVMSLSARNTFGNDGKLIDFLGPISKEKQSLHHSFLSALSHISYVRSENLLVLYKDLVPHSNVSSKAKCSTMRNSITTIFLDCLLNSEIRPVPENIKRAAEKLKGMMRQRSVSDSKSRSVIEKNDLRKITQLELEAVLRVSSHLQQIILDLSESSEQSTIPASESDFSMLTCSTRMWHSTSPLEYRQLEQRLPESACLPLPDARLAPSRLQDVVATLDCRLDDETGLAMSKQIQIRSVNQDLDSLNEEGLEKIAESRESCQHEVQCPVETERLRNITRIGDEAAGFGYTLIGCAQGCQHEVQSPVETERLRDITRIGDEAAGFGYALIGCALEEMSRLTEKRLETSVKDYLRSGIKRRRHETGTEVEQDLRGQDQVSFILNLSQNDPRISSRTMDRVKRRLLR